MPDQAYYDGDFWQARTLALPGESPGTNPEKWARITLLAKWRFPLTRLTYAHLLTLDGQTDKAAIERSVAYGRERIGLDDLIREEATAEEINRDRCRSNGFAHGSTAGAGRRIKAAVILDDAYRLIGWDADQIDDRDKADARACFSQAVQEVWESWWWREVMQCATVQFATTLDLNADYTAGQTAYDAAEDRYVTALRAATGSATDSFEIYVPNRAALAAFDPLASYAAGEQFAYAGADYQAWTDYAPGDGALLVRNAGTPEVNGQYTRDSLTGNYGQDGGDNALTFIAGEGWYLYTAFAVALYFCTEENFPAGPWRVDLGDEPAPTVTGGPPTDTNFFVPLQNWTPTLPWTSIGGIPQEPFGPVRSVSKYDPRIHNNPQNFLIEAGPAGTRVKALTVTHPWVWARRVTPIITGDDWDAATEYAATAGTDLVFGTTDDSFLVVEGSYLIVQT